MSIEKHFFLFAAFPCHSPGIVSAHKILSVFLKHQIQISPISKTQMHNLIIIMPLHTFFYRPLNSSINFNTLFSIQQTDQLNHSWKRVKDPIPPHSIAGGCFSWGLSADML